MTTKHLMSIIAAAAMLIPTLNSCKKGSNDPFLSLRSRKARVAGEWTIASWSESSGYNNSTSESANTDYWDTGSYIYEIVEGHVFISRSENYRNGSNYSSYDEMMQGAAKAAMTFEKDGTFTRKTVLSSLVITSGSSRTSGNMTEEIKGTWSFLGRLEDEYENKERMILNITERELTMIYVSSTGFKETETTTESFTEGQSSEVWDINRLKNKEMIIKGKKSSTKILSYTDSSSPNQSSEFTSTSGTITGTLVQE